MCNIGKQNRQCALWFAGTRRVRTHVGVNEIFPIFSNFIDSRCQKEQQEVSFIRITTNCANYSNDSRFPPSSGISFRLFFLRHCCILYSRYVFRHYISPSSNECLYLILQVLLQMRLSNSHHRDYNLSMSDRTTRGDA